jgi:hypothetical protein
MAKYYTKEEIFYMDSGVTSFGNDRLRYLLADTLTNVPKDVVDDVFEKCLFLVVESEEGGYFIPKSLLENSNLIAFPETLFNREPEEQIHTVLHEVAHFILGHKSPFEFPSKLEIHNQIYETQEKEANYQVEKWLKRR